MASPTLSPPPLDTALAQKDGKASPLWARWLQQLQAILKGAVTPSDWVAVGSGGKAPAFQGSWSNYDATAWQVAGFMLDVLGFVHIRGHIKSGAIPSTVFTLPPGYRPALNEQFSIMANNAWGLCTVKTDGTVEVSTGTGSPFVSLAGISFEAA